MWTARVRTNTLALTDPVTITGLTHVERYGPPDTLAVDGLLTDLGPAKTPGSGIYVTDDNGAFRFSGWLTNIERRGDGTGTLTYASDTQLLWDRNAWPSPLSAWNAPLQATDVYTGNAETRIRNLITRNAGASAYNGEQHANRRLTALRLPTNQNRGPSGTTTIRLEEVNLGELVARLAENSNLRVTVKQTYDPTPHLDVVISSVPDLSAWARFGDAAGGDLGMLGEDWSYTVGAHPASIVLPVAGTRDVVNMPIGHVPARETVWTRYVERFLDLTGTTDLTEINERVNETVAETVPLVEVQAPIVAGDLEFGDLPGQIPVGSKVSVNLDGEVVTERIRQVTTTVQATSGAPTVTVEPVVGSPDSGLSVEQKTLRNALRRLRRLESR